FYGTCDAHGGVDPLPLKREKRPVNKGRHARPGVCDAGKTNRPEGQQQTADREGAPPDGSAPARELMGRARPRCKTHIVRWFVCASVPSLVRSLGSLVRSLICGGCPARRRYPAGAASGRDAKNGGRANVRGAAACVRGRWWQGLGPGKNTLLRETPCVR